MYSRRRFVPRVSGSAAFHGRWRQRRAEMNLGKRANATRAGRELAARRCCQRMEQPRAMEAYLQTEAGSHGCAVSAQATRRSRRGHALEAAQVDARRGGRLGLPLPWCARAAPSCSDGQQHGQQICAKWPWAAAVCARACAGTSAAEAVETSGRGPLFAGPVCTSCSRRTRCQ